MRLGTRVLAVVAHPDDESFGLGAVISAMIAEGAEVHVLCLTRGEASTLREHEGDDLGRLREAELEAAAEVLGTERTTLCSHPDGGLSETPTERLLEDVVDAARQARPDLLLVFGPSGITGHADHRRATEVALRFATAQDLPVVAWVLPAAVAGALNEQTGAAFVGVAEDEIDLTIKVDRASQLDAIACHRSQEQDNPVLRLRLELLGDREHLAWLRR